MSSLVFLLTGLDNCYSYYYPGDKEVRPIYDENLGASWLKGEKLFVVYDNVKHERGENYQESLLFPRSTYFVPADLINCNVPIYYSLYQPKTVEHSLDNLLYANLRMKKLLEKREEIRKIAREILTDVNSQSTSKDDFPSLIENIHLHTSGGKYDGGSVNETVSTASQSTASQWRRFLRDKVAVNWDRITSDFQIEEINKERAEIIGQGMSFSESTRADPSPPRIARNKTRSFREDTPIPPILRIPSQIGLFLIRNRGISLISILFLIGAINLISYLRKSQKH